MWSSLFSVSNALKSMTLLDKMHFFLLNLKKDRKASFKVFSLRLPVAQNFQVLSVNN